MLEGRGNSESLCVKAGNGGKNPSVTRPSKEPLVLSSPYQHSVKQTTRNTVILQDPKDAGRGVGSALGPARAREAGLRLHGATLLCVSSGEAGEGEQAWGSPCRTGTPAPGGGCLVLTFRLRFPSWGEGERPGWVAREASPVYAGEETWVHALP